MPTKTILKQLLHVKNTVIENFWLEKDSAELDVLIIRVHPTKGHLHICPHCGKRMNGRYDSRCEYKRWRAMDLGSTKVFIEGPVERIYCPEHGVVTARVPWARHDCLFSREFENTVAWLALHLTKSAVAEYMRISWNTVGPIISRVRKEEDPHPEHRYDNLIRIGIDETSYKKGHKYLTVIVNHDNNSVCWVSDRHGKEVLTSFFEELTEEQRASIQLVSGDGAKWISECVSDFCPNAVRCIDFFHVVEWAGEALSEVRIEAWRQALKKSGQKRKRGRPKKGEEKTVDIASEIKGSTYTLGKAPENLTENQNTKLQMIAISEPKLYRAYLIKEELRLLLKEDMSTIEGSLKKWLWWASHSQIPAIYELQKKIRRHRTAILATAEHRLSNARVEATNNKIKVMIRMAYGFRNIQNLIDLILMKCSDIKHELPFRRFDYSLDFTHTS